MYSRGPCYAFQYHQKQDLRMAIRGERLGAGLSYVLAFWAVYG